jgi:hypothetical protein
MKDAPDSAATSLIDESTELKLNKVANSLRINWPATSEDIEKARKRLKKDQYKTMGRVEKSRPGSDRLRQRETWQGVAKAVPPTKAASLHRSHMNED